jgi:hypothetical protein
MANIDGIFKEFRFRFNKEHASDIKYDILCDYIVKHDDELYGTFYYKFSPLNTLKYATFSFVEKDKGVIIGLNITEAVKKYREYYKNKLNTMKVPVTYTKQIKPDWL